MSNWSRNRKTMYGGITIIAVVIIILIPMWKIFYHAPSCTDGVQNGDEQGVDCGGSCTRLCASAFLSPVVDWSRFEEVAPGLFNIATYIENPNIDAVAVNVPYHVLLYDNLGVPITEYSGTVTLPPHRNALAFQAAVKVQKRPPNKVLFSFTGVPQWQKTSDPLTRLAVTDKTYEEDANGSSLIVTLKNNNVLPLGRLAVYVVLYDKDGNAVGFSKTIVDGIDAGMTVTAPFTWPKSHGDKVVSVEVLPVAE